TQILVAGDLNVNPGDSVFATGGVSNVQMIVGNNANISSAASLLFSARHGSENPVPPPPAASGSAGTQGVAGTNGTAGANGSSFPSPASPGSAPGASGFN